MQTTPDIIALNENIKNESAFLTLIQNELSKVIIGQQGMVEGLLIGLLADGHVLLEGVPGLAKTLAINSLSQTIGASFSRVQFTPDLLPSDIIGTQIYNMSEHLFETKKGPVFSNFILADEINRAPAKVQSALLEAMQERQVTAGGNTMILPKPFFVLATQNPIEQEGTYPLPEAALDRFLFFIKVNYPSADEEADILRRTTGEVNAEIEKVLSSDELIELQDLVRSIPAADSVLDYAVALTRNSRPGNEAPDFINANVTWGAGPRAAQSLVMAANAKALLNGKSHASIADIQAVAKPALRHRVVLNFAAESEGLNSDSIIQQLIEFISEHATRFDG